MSTQNASLRDELKKQDEENRKVPAELNNRLENSPSGSSPPVRQLNRKGKRLTRIRVPAQCRVSIVLILYIHMYILLYAQICALFQHCILWKYQVF